MLKKILIGVLVAAIIGVCTGIYLFYKPAEKVENKKGVVVTAAGLVKEYNDNEKSADLKYLNKAIEVSGTINEVTKNQDGGLMVILDSGDPTIGIQCAMRDKEQKLAKGQSVTVKGFCSGKLMDVSLTDCVIK